MMMAIMMMLMLVLRVRVMMMMQLLMLMMIFQQTDGNDEVTMVMNTVLQQILYKKPAAQYDAEPTSPQWVGRQRRMKAG
eukprot:2438508-Pyramimonas_sp.AAC.1